MLWIEVLRPGRVRRAWPCLLLLWVCWLWDVDRIHEGTRATLHSHGGDGDGWLGSLLVVCLPYPLFFFGTTACGPWPVSAKHAGNLACVGPRRIPSGTMSGSRYRQVKEAERRGKGGGTGGR